MARMMLWESVQQFARLTGSLADKHLELPWRWGDYDEGARFAFFRVYEELRKLAVEIEVSRSTSASPQSITQRILAQYHLAYRDLQAVLLGASPSLAQVEPAPEEWPLLKVLIHMVSVERNFLTINWYALEQWRGGEQYPPEISDEAWEAFWAGDAFEKVVDNQELDGLLNYYDSLHTRVIDSFQDVTFEELQIPVGYWENTRMPLQFRLHRFDSHLRQHTIQVEKTLAWLGVSAPEAHRLLRNIYSALAQAEGALIGAPGYAAHEVQTVVARISSYSAEIAPLLT